MSSHPHTHPNHHEAHELDRGSPVNMLWGLVLTILTFLLIVVCVLSLDVFADATENPEDQTDPPSTEQPDPGPSDPEVNPPEGSDVTPGPDGPQQPDTQPDKTGYLISKSKQTQLIDSQFLNSRYAVLVDMQAREIVAGYEYDMPIYPAAMTNMMTLLVACELLGEEQLDDIITVSASVVEQMQREGVSGVGFVAGEEMTVRDLLYAVALESDGIACVQLAIYLTGSEQAFVEKMNAKAEEMGLIQTRFVNSTGAHHEGQVSTCREMASILLAAYDNEQVRELLMTKTYRTTTNVNPTGLTLMSSYFVDVVENLRKAGVPYQPSSGRVLMAKTGMTDEAGYCLASCYERAIDGKVFVAVTAAATNTMMYVNDYIMIYDEYVP